MYLNIVLGPCTRLVRPNLWLTSCDHMLQSIKKRGSNDPTDLVVSKSHYTDDNQITAMVYNDHIGDLNI